MLAGDAGSDVINGGQGDDQIFGGGIASMFGVVAGQDILTGGEGKDVFGFSWGDAVIGDPNGADIITDFTSAAPNFWSAGMNDDSIDVTGSGPIFFAKMATSATTIEQAQAEAIAQQPANPHVFLYNEATNTGYFIFDNDHNGSKESGIILQNAGYAAALNWGDVI